MARGRHARGQRGYTLLGLLAALVLVMLALGIAGPRWADERRREREQELLRVGGMYAQAIARYRDFSPAAAPRYPTQLEALLRDTRFAGVQRHLRRLYPDPLSVDTPWGLLHNDRGEIIGVHSLSPLEPLAPEAGPARAGVEGTVRRYADWHFIAQDRP